MRSIKIRPSVACILTFSCLMFLSAAVMVFCCSRYTERRYGLSEIDSGVYAIQSREISAASLCRYDVVEVCIDGTLRRFAGDVTISYTEDEPYVSAETNGLSNSDKVHLYIPKGTLMRETGASGSERRD